MKKRNIIIFSLSIIVIAVNIYLLSKNDKPQFNGDNQYYIDTLQYVGNDFKTLVIENASFGVTLPNNKDVLLIGLNNNFDYYYDDMNEFLRKNNIDDFDIEVYFITNNKKYLSKKRQNLFLYDSQILKDFTGLGENHDFLIMIRNNSIYYYKCHQIPPKDLVALIKKTNMKG